MNGHSCKESKRSGQNSRRCTNIPYVEVPQIRSNSSCIRRPVPSSNRLSIRTVAIPLIPPPSRLSIFTPLEPSGRRPVAFLTSSFSPITASARTALARTFCALLFDDILGAPAKSLNVVRAGEGLGSGGHFSSKSSMDGFEFSGRFGEGFGSVGRSVITGLKEFDGKRWLVLGWFKATPASNERRPCAEAMARRLLGEKARLPSTNRASSRTLKVFSLPHSSLRRCSMSGVNRRAAMELEQKATLARTWRTDTFRGYEKDVRFNGSARALLRVKRNDLG